MADAPDRLTAALADRYRIEREIGQGGMATVFMAEDLKHHRKVAIKVLKPELAAVLGADRFVQEITTTASLQHPNILPLFDSGTADGFLYYVMPYVEGESLRDRLNREKQLPVQEAVDLTSEIADALEYAHEHGVVHRDIKPENILIHAGRPMVADFGIALAVSAAAGGRMTETGLSLGTPHYMSPEQATAEPDITGRSDIYSLASVLYEMLTGEPPHLGGSAQQVIMKIVTEESAPVTKLRKSVPTNVAAAVSKALAKLPADRFDGANAFAEALHDEHFGTAAAGATGAAGGAGTRWRTIAFAAGALAVALAGTALWGWLRPTSGASTGESALPPIRFVLTTTDSANPIDDGPWPGAISPDGGTVVYNGMGPDNQVVLYSLRTDALEAHPIPGTASATQPYFSPDGTWLAFEQKGNERKVRLDGSSPVTITGGGVSNNGATWTPDGQIVIGSFGSFQGLAVVGAGGGQAAALTHVDTAGGERNHLWPIATPDPDVVVFTIWYGSLESSKLAAATLPDGKVARLGISGIRPLAVVDGQLVYVQADGSVMAVPFDPSHPRVMGSPVPVHDRVGGITGNNGNAGIYISNGGSLITGEANSTGQLVWLSRDGTTRVAVPGSRDYTWIAPSPDGHRIAAVISGSQGSDVWIWDSALATFSRLTTLGTVTALTWSPDGHDVVYVAADSASGYGVWSRPVTGGSPPRELFAASDLVGFAALSPAGKSLVLQAYRGSWDLLRVSLDSTPVARPYAASRFNEQFPRFSPDGKWVAYMSDETGQMEVYVRSFPDPSKKIQVSTGLGVLPEWSADGSRLYYVTASGRHLTLLDARVRLSPTFGLLGRDSVVSLAGRVRSGYGISPDGQRVLATESVTSGFRIVVSPNWITELRRRLATSGGEGAKR